MLNLLFSFGTLRLQRVQQELFGREIPMRSDSLRGHLVGELRITDPEVVRASGSDLHPALISTGRASDVVEGAVLEIDNAELEAADRYEEAAFRRVQVLLESGRIAWAYLPKVTSGP